MGEQFISKHTRDRSSKRDAAYERELATPTLFSDRQHIYAHSVACQLTDRTRRVCPGETVIVCVTEDGRINIARANQVIGSAKADAAVPIIEAAQFDRRCRGLIPAVVEEASQIGGYFTVRCRPEDTQHE